MCAWQVERTGYSSYTNFTGCYEVFPDRSILWSSNFQNLWVKQNFQEPLAYEGTLQICSSQRQCAALHNVVQPWKPSRSISGDSRSTEHSGKCCTTPCFYWKKEAGLGTRASGTAWSLWSSPAAEAQRSIFTTFRKKCKAHQYDTWSFTIWSLSTKTV